MQHIAAVSKWRGMNARCGCRASLRVDGAGTGLVSAQNLGCRGTVTPYHLDFKEQHDYTNQLRMHRPINPVIEVTAFITEYDRSVCETLIPQYSFTIQKPASLTCERIDPPVATAITIRAGSARVMELARGARMPAAV